MRERERERERSEQMEKEDKPQTTKGYICKKKMKYKQRNQIKNINKEQVMEKQDSGHTAARNAYDHKGGLMKIQSVTLN